jgi:probable rRNA maturation factor
LSIKIFYDEIDFRLIGWRKIKKIIEKVISDEKRISGDLIFILTNDTNIKNLNKKFLKHNYYTDVISFNYGDEKKVEGEIYISLDTVKINAINYEVSYNLELLRVIIHGVLHLCGYEDKSKNDRIKMRRKENFLMKIYGRLE